MSCQDSLRYAISVIESIPPEVREFMEDEVLDESIDMKRLRSGLRETENNEDGMSKEYGELDSPTDAIAFLMKDEDAGNFEYEIQKGIERILKHRDVKKLIEDSRAIDMSNEEIARDIADRWSESIYYIVIEAFEKSMDKRRVIEYILMDVKPQVLNDLNEATIPAWIEASLDEEEGY